MDFIKLTYDMCRCYLNDCRTHLSDDVYKSLLGAIRARDLKHLASCTDLYPETLQTLDGRRILMQIEAFFKKNALFSSADSCRETALSSFNRAERMCRITNRRLDHYGIKRDRLDPDLKTWVSKMERDISNCLGPFDKFLDELPRLVKVTSGATVTKSRRKSLPFLRTSKKVTCTSASVKYLQTLSHYWGYGKLKPKLVEANRIEFVPKNWKTDRTIACEAEGNSLLQLAGDAYIKRQLKKIRVNLRNQSTNQEMAKQGSIDGSLATIDLSMASDTLSFNTVALLLPFEWFQYFDDVRSHFASGRGIDSKMKYAKFSSMGNGATFTLETLVFATACRAVGSKTYSVYGDDIVIETELVDKLLKLFKFLGFSVNTDKSFTAGPFRESCGTNWFSGVDITPVYLRDFDLRKATQCHVVNTLASICTPEGQLEALLLALITKQNLPLVPFTENTMSGVWIDPKTARSLGLIVRKHGIDFFRGYIPQAKTGRCSDIRANFLWHLSAYKQRNRIVPKLNSIVRNSRWSSIEEPIISSRYTTSSHKYVRKWVHWRIPVVGAPVNLIWFTERLVRPRTG